MSKETSKRVRLRKTILVMTIYEKLNEMLLTWSITLESVVEVQLVSFIIAP